MAANAKVCPNKREAGSRIRSVKGQITLTLS